MNARQSFVEPRQKLWSAFRSQSEAIYALGLNSSTRQIITMIIAQPPKIGAVMRLLRNAAAVVLLAFLSLETGLRYFGAIDFPLYENSPVLGYVPQLNQRGSFLGKNTWAFNDLSMGVGDAFDPGASPRNILLVGDSIVMGGNPVNQPDKLGPAMNSLCPRVWPIAAGSWAFLNELRYLHLHADMLSKIDRIVFVLNSGDFDEAASWASEYTHPTQRPISASLYLVSKQLTHVMESARKGDNNWRGELALLRGHYRGPITVVLYPTKTELGTPGLRSSKLDAWGKEIGPDRTSFVMVANEQNWSAADYRDEIHPTSEGTRKLARYIVASIPECL